MMKLRDCDDRWTRPMSITWLSSDLGASKCYHDGDKPRPPSDTPVISSDPGPSSTSRVFICSATIILQRTCYSLFSLLTSRGCHSLKISPWSKIAISSHQRRWRWNFRPIKISLSQSVLNLPLRPIKIYLSRFILLIVFFFNFVYALWILFPLWYYLSFIF